jgi:hypothetical protein
MRRRSGHVTIFFLIAERRKSWRERFVNKAEFERPDKLSSAHLPGG